MKEKIKKKILVTAALPYINNLPHLGHIVGSHLPADIFARYQRLKGNEVLFIGGSDENGTPSEVVAESIGVPIEKFCDKLHEEHKKIYDWFNISYDLFSRTSKKIHHATAQEFFLDILKNKYIEEGEVEMYYCPFDRRFLPERYVKGTCANCGYENAYGDQCEKCASILDVNTLKNAHCKICGKVPEIKTAKHLFFRLDKFSAKLNDWLKNNEKIRSQVKDLAFGWIKEGLKKRCITRDLKHGVKVPLKGYEDKVLYVWFEAPISYISFAKEATEKWRDFWQKKDGEIYHFLGKDNIPFHAVFWPAMLMANGKLNLPTNVVGLQYLNYEGQKFSKSKKLGIFCEQLPKTGINVDLLRGYLTYLIPETSDTEFKWKDFQLRANNGIIGNYANFVNRTLSFVYNKLEGNIKKPKDSELSSLDKNLINTIKEKTQVIENYLEKAEIRKAFSEIIALSNEGNKYIDYSAPWKLVNEDKEKARKVLYLCTNLCRTLAIVSNPYLPETSQKIWKQLNLNGKVDEPEIWNSVADLAIPSSHKIGKPSILFERLTESYLDDFKNIVSNVKDLKSYFKKV